jgi:hypothetical protein
MNGTIILKKEEVAQVIQQYVEEKYLNPHSKIKSVIQKSFSDEFEIGICDLNEGDNGKIREEDLSEASKPKAQTPVFKGQAPTKCGEGQDNKRNEKK